MLHHIEIYVSDLAKSRAFYDFLLRGLGYEPYQEWEAGFSYKKAEQYLVFVQTKEAFLDQGYHRCRVGLNHLAFHAGSCKELDNWRQALLDRGVRLLYDDQYPYASGGSYHALYCQDPDGIKIELVANEGGCDD